VVRASLEAFFTEVKADSDEVDGCAVFDISGSNNALNESHGSVLGARSGIRPAEQRCPNGQNSAFGAQWLR
jgi:hypothetical protein